MGLSIAKKFAEEGIPETKSPVREMKTEDLMKVLNTDLIGIILTNKILVKIKVKNDY